MDGSPASDHNLRTNFAEPSAGATGADGTRIHNRSFCVHDEPTAAS